MAMSSERRREERRNGWIMVLTGLPLAVAGAAMTVLSPFLSRNFVLGVLCTLMFGSCAAMGASALWGRAERAPVIDPKRTYYLRLGGRNILPMAGVCLVFGAMGVFILTEVPWLSVTGILGGFLGAGFFGLGGLYMVYKGLRGSGPAYDIGPRGIKVHGMRGLEVPWSKVASVWETHVHQQSFLCFEIPEWDALEGQISAANRVSANLNVTMGFPPLTISASGLDVSTATLRAIVTTHAEAAGVPVAIAPE